MHANQVIWHEENIRIIWEASHQCCIMREVIHKEVNAGGRFNFFLDSAKPIQDSEAIIFGTCYEMPSEVV